MKPRSEKRPQATAGSEAGGRPVAAESGSLSIQPCRPTIASELRNSMEERSNVCAFKLLHLG